MVIVRTARLIVRRFEQGDAEAMTAALGDPEVMRFSDEGALPPPQVGDWIARQISRYGDRDRLGRWAVVEHEPNAVAGYIGLLREQGRCGAGEAELGYRLARACWGRGYATEAAAAVVGYGFVTLGLDRIVAIVDPDNTASVRVIEKLGMRFDSLISFPGYDHPDRKYVLSRPKLAGPARAASCPPTASRPRPLSDDL